MNASNISNEIKQGPTTQCRENFSLAKTTFVTLTVSLLHAGHKRQQKEVYWEACCSSLS